ncbi:adenosine deaminase-like protein [Moniliophthora roreri]|uniref:Adenosine deaminase domain-containing protein n=1 Tax=Moniliophthora roreri TaxID=221103 RepID=A0A0W0F8E6_MONRR|nr:adenosine deaminase-like protein [Moniliophthora roreri]
MSSEIAGHCAEALASLSPAQISFIQNLPKVELHAHLNGSIPLSTIQELSKDYAAVYDPGNPNHKLSPAEVEATIQQLTKLDVSNLHGFFGPFAAVYALTSSKEGLGKATRAVLAGFLDGETPQCTYLELRTTPKEAVGMTRLEYVQTVLEEIERYPKEKAAFILSLDRRMKPEIMQECVDLATKLKAAGRRVVGIDLCGDPLAGDMTSLSPYITQAKQAGLGVTLHIAETKENPPDEALDLLAYKPNRLGHATFLNEKALEVVLKEKMCVEICLSSNLLCKTVDSLDAHHIRLYLEQNHPIAICTDDMLPFRNSLLAEYALLLAQPPLGLGLTGDEVAKIAEMGVHSTFSKL